MTETKETKPVELTEEQRKLLKDILARYPAKPDSGLLEDDGMGSCPFEDDSCTISINDWEE